jgi:hypothetical protein
VGQPERQATTSNDTCFPLSPRLSAACSVEHRHFSSPAPVVGHPVKTLSDVRRADARSAQICGPDSIGHSFHVSLYSGETKAFKRRLNDCPKDFCNCSLVI